MTKENRTDPRNNFVPRWLPWLLAGLMLGIYWFTLNRWISLFNMEFVARLSGWKWEPELGTPLICLLTYPLRWLPAGQIPFALDLFSAVCAALTLALLARTVALLPQDRTEAQRMREHSDFAFLTTRSAWLPPVFAVLVCGLHFRFWQEATNFTGESLDLLVFAFAIWALVEHRLDDREGPLMAAMFLYGADMSENVALIGFFPLLVVALIWIRGLAFFNLRFLLRIIMFGTAGSLLYLLLPTLAVTFGHLPASAWWLAVKSIVTPQYHTVKFFLNDYEDSRYNLFLISLTTLLPVFLLAFRWQASFGDRSHLGSTLTTLMIHVVYALMLYICVWGMFDPPFGARHLSPRFSFLTFSYLAALGVGYYSGYFLLIFKPVVSRATRRRKTPATNLTSYAVVAALVVVTLFTALATAGLVCKNGPAIRSINGDSLRTYARLAAASLPPSGGILLSDSESGDSDIPRRLYLLQEELLREGRQNQYVPVDTLALKFPDYQRYLHKQYPLRWPLVVDPKNQGLLNPRGLLSFMGLLSKSNSLYYLHPSYGYYFEVFYQEPHGLVYQLKRLPEDTLRPPPPDAGLINENESFWNQAQSEAFEPVLDQIADGQSFQRSPELIRRLWQKLHVTPEPNLNAQFAGQYYSRSLDFWGVQAQRAQQLPRAQAHFQEAIKLNADNAVAAINLEFNHDLQAGRPLSVDPSRATPDHYGQFRSWDALVTANGPLDEPSFCFADGNMFLQGSLLNQSLASFARVRELVPDYLPGLLSLGEVCVLAHRPLLALDALKQPLDNPGKFSLNATNSTELNVIAAAAFIQNTNLAHGVALLEREISYHPDDENLLASAAQLYIAQGLLTNALHVIKIKLATRPDDADWLFSLGYTYMRMEDEAQAIAAFTKVIALDPSNKDAWFNRAVAFLKTDRLNAARSDYQQLQVSFPKSFQVAYGLGEIAWRQHDTNTAAQNYVVYLANAPTNTAEFKTISSRLAELKGRSN